MRLGLVSAAFPPVPDGIGDNTDCLSRELAQDHEVAVFTAASCGRRKRGEVDVIPCFDGNRPSSIRALLEAVAKWQPDWLFVQYNPFAFGPRGFNPWLPLVLGLLRRKTRLAVMFHETYIDKARFRDSVMRLWQVPQARAIGRLAEIVFVSCDAFRHEVGFSRPDRITRLPAGSSLPLSPLTTQAARTRLGFTGDKFVLGTFGTAHRSRRFDWMNEVLLKLLSQGKDALFLYVGSEPERVRPHFPEPLFHATGPLPASEAGDALRCIDVFLSPFSDGISARRSSAVAALQHRLPVITTRGCRTDAVFEAPGSEPVYLSNAASAREFAGEVAGLLQSPERLRGIAARGHDLFLRVFDWPRIAEALIAALPGCL